MNESKKWIFFSLGNCIADLKDRVSGIMRHDVKTDASQAKKITHRSYHTKIHSSCYDFTIQAHQEKKCVRVYGRKLIVS